MTTFIQNSVVENISRLLPVTISKIWLSSSCLHWASKSWWRFVGIVFDNFVRIGTNIGMSPEIGTLEFSISKSFINWLMSNLIWSFSTNATRKFLHLWRTSICKAGDLFANAGSAKIFAALIPMYSTFVSV